jgi:predicted transcriptional regulator
MQTMKKVFLLLTISILLIFNVFSQKKHNTDSILTVIEKSTNDSVKIINYVKLMYRVDQSDSLLIEKYETLAKKLANKSSIKQNKAFLFEELGFYYQSKKKI